MLVKKIVLLPDCKQDFLHEMSLANEKIRSQRGFLSGIILSSRVNPDVIYHFSMWMDLQSSLDFSAYLPHFIKSHQHLVSSFSEENLQVLISVTAEGDFRPVLDA